MPASPPFNAGAWSGKPPAPAFAGCADAVIGGEAIHLWGIAIGLREGEDLSAAYDRKPLGAAALAAGEPLPERGLTRTRFIARRPERARTRRRAR
jgi:hypothetical protein